MVSGFGPITRPGHFFEMLSDVNANRVPSEPWRRLESVIKEEIK